MKTEKYNVQILTVLFLFASQVCFASQPNKEALKAKTTGQLSAAGNKGFYKNKGQIVDQNYKPNSAVKYLLCTSGFNVQLRQTGFSYDTYTDSPDSNQLSIDQWTAASKGMPLPKDEKQPKPLIRHYHRVDIQLVDCNPNTQMIAEGKSKAYYNYFTAGTPKGGVSYVHTYQKVTYKNIYPHIDLVFNTQKTSKNNIPLEYDFIVHPGGNISDIKLQYKGTNKVSLNNNLLTVNVTAGDFTENIPSSYWQDTKQSVKVDYASLGDNTFGFTTHNSSLINHNSSLVIDPTPNLEWGTYYGGSDRETPYDITLDASNNVYITGWTYSTNAIATSGAYQTTSGGDNEAFIAKFNSTGSALLWGTYYGGSKYDRGTGIAVDASDNVYITGATLSPNGLATTGAYKTTSGAQDAFVAKFSPTGSALLWGTYYGGSQPDAGTGIALDTNDNVYIVGFTESGNGIATPGAYKTTHYGGRWSDVFVAKFSPNGSTLLWGTYYGGTAIDRGYGIALDASNNVYIVGNAQSLSDIATAGAYQTTFGGGVGYDVFVAKFNPTGSALLWGTYYGGSKNDVINVRGNGIALDASDNVYITGNTFSTNAIATAGAYQTTSGGATDAFVAKLSSNGSTLVWGTYYGGSSSEDGAGITLDASDNVYITGGTSSTNSIATSGAYLTTHYGGFWSDAFVAKFNPTGSILLWGTYYGGSQAESAGGIVLDKSDNVYIVGNTKSPKAIATAGAYHTTGGGNSDAFVAKFCQPDSSSLSQSICQGDSILLEGKWQTTNGTYRDTLTAINGCDSIVITNLTVNSITNGTDSTIICQGDSILLGGVYQFTAGNYMDTLTAISGCDSIVVTNLTVNPITSGTDSATICQGDSILLGGAYQNISGNYTDTLTAVNGCDSIITTNLTIYPSPIASFTLQPQGGTIITKILYKDNSQGAIQWLWEFGDGDSSSTRNAEHNYKKTGQYGVVLMVTNQFGCSDTATRQINIRENLFIPNVFSPNDDGVNDKFIVKGAGMKEYSLKIYNRWGKLIYSSEKLGESWDGTTTDGQEASAGNYYYTVIAKTRAGKDYSRTGYLTLFR